MEPTAGDPSAGLRERLLDHAVSLPLGDRAALMRVASLCGDPRATAASIAFEASRDEGFTALLLKIANSAYSASRYPISDVQQAVVRLGFRLVQGVALAAPGLRLLDGGAEDLEPARRELHRHALRVGVIARAIAPPGELSESAMAAGLVHNLGLNVLAAGAPAEFRALVFAGSRGQRLKEIEEELLGFTHAELGGALAERWGYPLSLVVAIAEHDLDEPSSAIAAVVRQADVLVRERGVGIEPPEPEALLRIPAPVVARAEGLLDAMDRLETLPPDAPPPPDVPAALLNEARAALG